jgi:hypothetical protein
MPECEHLRSASDLRYAAALRIASSKTSGAKGLGRQRTTWQPLQRRNASRRDGPHHRRLFDCRNRTKGRGTAILDQAPSGSRLRRTPLTRRRPKEFVRYRCRTVSRVDPIRQGDGVPLSSMPVTGSSDNICPRLVVRSRCEVMVSRNCDGATSISVDCDDCCLTHVVARCGPREADTIGIRPVLPRAWKWQRIRNMCHDRVGPQIGDVRRQHENTRTAHYADRKGDEQFPTQSHLYLPSHQSGATLIVTGRLSLVLGFGITRAVDATRSPISE